MTVKNEHELKLLKAAGRIVREVLGIMESEITPGITTAELDSIGAAALEHRGAISAPRSVYKFPGATCISLNNEAAHGIPGPRALKASDVVNIDVSASYQGFFADTGASFLVGRGTPKARNLLGTTKKALTRALGIARAGTPLNALGKVIEDTVTAADCSIIRNLSGHGVGGNIHEPPTVLNYFDRHHQRKLHPGLVIAIEPIVSTGPTSCHDTGDGWTLAVPGGHLCAQFEHSIVITKGAPIILTG